MAWFFVSSRRRHTRSKRDWSSDVCSSDLWYTIFQRGGHMPITITSIKAKLDGKIGEPLTITSRLGRKKSKTRHGVLRETFPSVFIIELNHDENAVERVSYSYTDILTKNIELNFG